MNPSNPTGTAADDDLTLAAKVHYSFQPPTYRNDHVDVAAKIRPLNQIGGDYYAIFPLNGALVACMCDVVGHGVASALFAARVSAFVMSRAAGLEDPCRLVESLNEFLCRHLTGTGLFTTFFAVLFDFGKREMTYAGAGHPPMLMYDRQADSCEFLESSTTILGMEHPLPIPCFTQRRALHGGDKLLLYTDGLMEASRPGGGHFGKQGLKDFTQAHHALDSTAFNERLFEDANCYDCRIKDDILILTMSVK